MHGLFAGLALSLASGAAVGAEDCAALAPAFPLLPALAQPVALLPEPGGGHWLLALREGRVLRFENAAGAALTQTVLDWRDRIESGPPETGLLGMALAPDFDGSRRLYLSYTTGQPLASVLVRLRLDARMRPEYASTKLLLQVRQPYANHNGGHLAFGPDGYLYLGLGDGGGNPEDRAQDPNEILGKLLRLDVSSPSGYAIPEDNPYARGGGRPEIWASGLRNPWRFSFDAKTGTLWLADVGQDAYEEVNRMVAGGNYGWNRREGAHCFGAETCDRAGLIEPVAEYGHDEGCSITGGHVYRGKALPWLDGQYVFGDFCSGRIWRLDEGGKRRLLLHSELHIPSFAQGEDGELYVLNFEGKAGHGIYRLAPGACGKTEG
ncbi:MAG: PQQ-dependent sugar dehydrogenase [Gammaproteobacteria bacterium]|nr:PQQ-dependent sugar dehydrogenase [Gammaproteobacteria bacterium]